MRNNIMFANVQDEKVPSPSSIKRNDMIFQLSSHKSSNMFIDKNKD